MAEPFRSKLAIVQLSPLLGGPLSPGARPGPSSADTNTAYRSKGEWVGRGGSPKRAAYSKCESGWTITAGSGTGHGRDAAVGRPCHRHALTATKYCKRLGCPGKGAAQRPHCELWFGLQNFLRSAFQLARAAASILLGFFSAPCISPVSVTTRVLLVADAILGSLRVGPVVTPSSVYQCS